MTHFPVPRSRFLYVRFFTGMRGPFSKRPTRPTGFEVRTAQTGKGLLSISVTPRKGRLPWSRSGPARPPMPLAAFGRARGDPVDYHLPRPAKQPAHTIRFGYPALNVESADRLFGDLQLGGQV